MVAGGLVQGCETREIRPHRLVETGTNQCQTSSMAANSPLASLPLARIIAVVGTDPDPYFHAGAVRGVDPGRYRLLNAGSSKCLSYSSRPASSAAGGQPRIAGWACGVP